MGTSANLQSYLGWITGLGISVKKRSQIGFGWYYLTKATELGYCKDTIFRHLHHLVEMGVIERQRAKRWATDRAWKYRIVSQKLAQYIDLCENQTIDSNESEHGQSEVRTSTVENQENNIGSNSSSSYAQPQAEPVAVESEEGGEKANEPTDEEIKNVCIQLRRLSPDISINPQVRSAIRSFWHNVPAGLARVKNALGKGWCKQPNGVFVQTLKNGASRDEEVVVVAKEYPRPTLEQLNQVGEMGELVYTGLNEPGYPEVVAVNTGSGVLPWWVVLGVEVA